MNMARSSYFRAVALFLLGAGAAGCPASSEDVRPPSDQLFFPAGLELSADEAFLFVACANSELRYDSGTLAVIDLEAVNALVDDWLATATPPADTAGCEDCCEPDETFSHQLVCNEARVILSGATVRLGNFATDVRAQMLESGDLRLFVPVRGDPSVTWADFSPSSRDTYCGGSGTLPRCDEDHRLTQLRNDYDLPTLSDEPFGIYVDSGNGYAMVSHFTSGTVTLIDAPPDGAPPMLVDVLGGLFASNPTTGVRGAVGVAGRTPGVPNSLVYVTSRSEARVQTLYVHRPATKGSFPTIVASEFFFLHRVVPSDDGRGIAFSDDGERLHIVNRDPPMLHTFDTSLAADGYPRNELVSAVEVCSGASMVALADVGRGERAFVSCFRDGQMWVVDTAGAVVEAIVSVGRGPHAIAVAPSRQLLFVSNFLEDTVSVVDLTPGTSTEYRVVLRLGRTRQSGGE